MKKDDLKKSIDNINPDSYMGNRLKAKITTNTVPVKRNRQVTLSITAFCLAFAIIFGVGFISQPQTPAPQQNTTENTIPQNKTVNAFIMVASAANSESTETATVNKTLELNEEYPYEVYLKVRDVRGLSDAETSKIGNELEDIFNNRITEEAVALQRLKDEGAIEQDSVSFIDSISSEYLYNDDYTDMYMTEMIRFFPGKTGEERDQMRKDMAEESDDETDIDDIELEYKNNK